MVNKNEVITLNICERGLATYIYDWYIEEDVIEYSGDTYVLKDGGYGTFEPNCVWTSVQVKRQDIDRYLDLYNQYLECSWEPNQDWDTREENEKIMKGLRKEMKSLEVTAVEKI